MSATDPRVLADHAYQAVRMLAHRGRPDLTAAVEVCLKLALECELLKAEVLPALRNRVGNWRRCSPRCKR